MTIAHVHLVDDDEAIRDGIAWLLQSCGIPVQTYPSAEDFLRHWTPQLAGCIILDMRLGGMSGLDCFDRLKDNKARQPVIFLTGHGDVPLAVATLKKGAFDFFEKPFDDKALLSRIQEAMAFDAAQQAQIATVDSVNARISILTTREKQIMERVLAGKQNKLIADELHISIRTVEVHRANLFDKMEVKTAVELANLLQQRP